MKSNIKKIVLVALYTAIFVVLSIFGTINVLGFKVTVQNLPIYLAAVTMGAGPGAFVGFVGMLINQMITYGFTATTLFWILPQTILGAVTGYIFESKIVKVGQGLKFWVTIIILNVMVTLLNTIVLIIDSVMFGYYNYLLIFGTLIIRLMSTILIAIVYCIIIPVVDKLTKKIH